MNTIRSTVMAFICLSFTFAMAYAPGSYASQDVALWAQGSEADSLLWQGDNSSVTGDVHSNGGIKDSVGSPFGGGGVITGTGNSVVGNSSYVTVLDVDQAANSFTPAPAQSASEAWPVSFSVADYQPGGAAAVAAGSDYHDVSASCNPRSGVQLTFGGFSNPPEGVYYANCALKVNVGSETLSLTLVSTKDVLIQSSAGAVVTSAVDGLLALSSSTSSSNESIRVAGSNGTFNGYLVAEYGTVRLAGSGHLYQCGVFANNIEISGNGYTIEAQECGVTPNQAPIAVDDSVQTPEDTSILIDVVGNDSDPEGLLDVTSVQIDTSPVNGIATVNSTTGEIDYTPNLNFFGQDTLTYTVSDSEGLISNVANVTVSVTGLNDLPVAVDDSRVLAEDASVSVAVLDNDFDVDGTLVISSVQVVSAPANGTAIADSATGEILYTPNSNFSGTDSFAYTVADNDSQESAPATVSLTIQPVNDAPDVGALTVSTSEDTPVSFTVVATDADGDSLSYSVTTPTVNGSLSGVGPDFTYTPDPDFSGSDSFVLTVSDGTDSTNEAISISVQSVNDAPDVDALSVDTSEDVPVSFAVVAADADGDSLSYTVTTSTENGTLAGAGPDFTYTPNPDFNGSDSFVLAVSDGTATTAETISITVQPVNDVPVADAQSYSVNAGQQLSITLTGSDIDGDVLTFAITQQPQFGSISGTAPNLTYLASSTTGGSDSVEFVVNDGSVDSIPAVIQILVSSPNEAPEITSSPVTTATQNVPYSYQVDAIDPNNDPLTFSLTAAPDTASITSQTGLISWLPGEELRANVDLDNPNCSRPLDIAGTQISAADIIFAVDESGSMIESQAWIGELGPSIDAALIAKNVGNGANRNLYGVLGFSNQNRLHELDGQPVGPIETFQSGFEQLETTISGDEDGYLAVHFIYDLYPVREEAPTVVFLVTDEGRAIVEPEFDFDSALAKIQESGSTFNAVIDADFLCGDGRVAFGMDSNQQGFVLDGMGGYETCANTTVVGGLSQIYAELAAQAGGFSWDLDQLVFGGDNALSLTQAVIDFVAQDIVDEISRESLADLAVIELDVSDLQATVTVKNRGALDLSSGATIEVFDEIQALGSASITELASGQSVQLSIDLSAVPSGLVTASVFADEVSVVECFTENNMLSSDQFLVSVADPFGLIAEQSFRVFPQFINGAPSITPLADQSAFVNVAFEGAVLATDPDTGDQLSFSVVQSPASFSIDSVTGAMSFRPIDSQVGSHVVTIEATDLSGLTDQVTFNLEVLPGVVPPVITSEPELVVTVLQTYEYQVEVQADPASVLTFSVFSSQQDLMIDSQSGLVTWLVDPNTEGEFTDVIIRVVDQFGNADYQFYNFYVETSNSRPRITRFIQHQAEEGVEFSRTISASDANASDVLVWELIQAPAGMTIAKHPTNNNGVVNWPASSVTSGAVGTEQDLDPNCAIVDGQLPSIEMKARWTNLDYFRVAHPVVGPLYDSNADGVLNSLDRVAIVGVARTSGSVFALDAHTGHEIWRTNAYGSEEDYQPAMVDLDGDGSSEILYVAFDEYLIALNSDGSIRWRSDIKVLDRNSRTSVSVSDLDNDGVPEILVGRSIVDVNGNVLWRFPDVSASSFDAEDGTSLAVDLNGDGFKEVAFYNQVRDAFGNLLWEVAPGISRTIEQSYFAAADLDGDGSPELVVSEELTSNSDRLLVLDEDGTVLWTTTIFGASPVVIANFVANDPAPEIYVASGSHMFSATGDYLWRADATTNMSTASAADLDGDGQLEVLYQSSQGITVLAGETGDRRARYATGFSSAVSLSAPALVDYDNDGIGEIVMGHGGGVSVFESADGDWLPGSSIYPYANYSVGELNSDMTVSTGTRVWDQSISTRATNSAVSNGDKYQPLADVSVAYVRQLGASLQTRLVQTGQGRITTDLYVDFYYNDPSDPANKIAEDVLTANSLQALNNNGAVTLSSPRISSDFLDGEIYAVVRFADDVQECHTDNNMASGVAIWTKVTDPFNAFAEAVGVIGVKEPIYAPVFTSSPATIVTYGQTYEYQVTATDSNRFDRVRFNLTDGPVGAGIDSVTGLISWVPTRDQIGSHTFVVEAGDLGALDRAQSFSVEVQSDGSTGFAPVISYSPLTQAYNGFLYQDQVLATDPDGQYLFYSLTQAPSGMRINGLTGRITWVPASDQLGTSLVTVSVRDEDGLIDTLNYSVVVDTNNNSAPTISSSPSGLATVGVQYAYQIEATDPDGDLLTYGLSEAPTGMTITSDGLVTWTPLQAQLGAHDVAMTVSDSFGYVVTQSLTVNVVAAGPNGSPIITSDPLTYGVPNMLYSYQVTASDPDGDALTFGLPTAPAGMTLSPNGLIQWTPTIIGSYDVVVTVVDVTGNGQAQTFTVDVNTQSIPEITSTPTTTATVGANYAYDVQGYDMDGDTLAYSLSVAPAGMQIGSANGVIVWSPTVSQVGANSVTVQVDDMRGGVASQSFVITVSDVGANQPPVVTSVPSSFAREGQVYTYQVEATDPNNDTLNYTLLSGPADASVGSDGLLLWTPMSVDTVDMVLRIDDGQFFTDQTWNIQVASMDAMLKANGFLAPQFVEGGDVVTISANPTGQAGPVNVSITVDGLPISVDANYSASVIADSTFGPHEVIVTVDDGVTLDQDVLYFYVQDPSDTTPPVAEISAPLDGEEVTNIREVIGTASDDNLANYRLSIAPIGSNQYRTLVESTTAVVDSELGTLDPTMMMNGFYNLALVVSDFNGQQSSAQITVEVNEDLKIGNFAFTIEDLNIPVSGVPIVVNRTYDTRRRGEDLDFGYGWSIDYQNVRVQENRILGEGWVVNSSGGTIQTYCVEPAGRHSVNVRLPDGSMERFDMTAENPCQSITPPDQVTPLFIPRAGTHSTLVADDSGALLINNSNLIDGTTGLPYNPSGYTLTTVDNYVYDLDETFGIRQVIDPNGNTLTFSDQGIVHSSGVGISFTRDDQDRIVNIIDPNGAVLAYDYDANGDLVGVTDRVGNLTQHVYDTDHLMLEYIDPRGINPLRNEYDEDGRLVATIDADGNRTEMEHDLDNNREVITNRRGFEMTFIYDDEGNVVSETNGAGETTTYTYDDEGNELTKTNALGHVITKTFDERDNELTVTNHLGHVTTNTYDAGDRPLTTMDALGRVTTMGYDTSGNLLDILDAEDGLTVMTYGESGNLGTISDPLGNRQSAFTYNFKGYRVLAFDAVDTVTQHTHDDNGNDLTATTSRTDENGATVTMLTSYVYDNENDVVEMTDAEGNITKVEYNSLRKKSADIDALGRRTEYTYDARGNLTLTTYPDDTTEQVGYDENNNEISRTDRLGRVTTMEYDGADRLIRTTYPDDAFTTTEYDMAGRVVAETDANGNRTEYTLDDADRRTRVKDALDFETVYTYDNAGNMLTMTDAKGHVTTYEYDDLNRRVKTIFDDNSEMIVVFDAAGRKTSETDQAGATTDYTYDAAGRLLTVTNALSQLTSYTYDEQGNKLTQTDAEGRTTSWAYDNLGRVTKRTLPLGQFETFEYDVAGRVTSTTDFNGQTTTMTYDIMDRLIRKDFFDGSFEAWTYTDKGQVKTSETVNGVITHTYDDRDRLIRVDQPDGAYLEYSYDAQGNRLSVTTPAGVTSYTFDELNRLKTTTDAAGLVTTYSYDPVGNRAGMVYAMGNTTTYTYDELNRLTRLEHKDVNGQTQGLFIYTLGPAGNRLKIQDHTGRVVDYTYDTTYKLLTESITDDLGLVTFDVTYTYDLVGNRLTKSLAGTVVVDYTYDDNDRIQSEFDPVASATTSYSYDDNGNTLERNKAGVFTTYTYDAENQLSTLVDSGATTAYGYDDTGMRVSKTDGGTNITYLLDKNRPYAQVLSEYNSAASVDFNVNGTATVSYTYGDDLISQERGGNTSTYLYDGLGSTRLLIDQSGAVTDSYLYEAFGGVLETMGSTPNDYLYTGEQFDANSGFYYLRARYYNPILGRFHSLDTYLGRQFEPITLHKYLYANANPVRFIDPSGNMSLLEISIGVRLHLSNVAITLSPAIYLINHVMTKMNIALLSRASTMLTSGVQRLTGIPWWRFRLTAGQKFELWLQPAMRLVGGVRNVRIPHLTNASRYHVPDWVRGFHVYDAKLGQAINMVQARAFMAFAGQGGGSVTYFTLTRPSQAIVSALQSEAAAVGTIVKIIPLTPF